MLSHSTIPEKNEGLLVVYPNKEGKDLTPPNNVTPSFILPPIAPDLQRWYIVMGSLGLMRPLSTKNCSRFKFKGEYISLCLKVKCGYKITLSSLHILRVIWKVFHALIAQLCRWYSLLNTDWLVDQWWIQGGSGGGGGGGGGGVQTPLSDLRVFCFLH